MTEPTSRTRLRLADRTSEFWIPVALGAVLGAAAGWQIHALFAQPGIEALEGAVLAIFVIGALLVISLVGVVLMAFRRRSAGKIVLLAASACALATVVVATTASFLLRF